MNSTTLNIEALIFSSEQSVTIFEIMQVLQAAGEENVTEDSVKEHIESIKQKYDDANFAIALVEINKGYQFLTKKEHYQLVNQLQIQRSKKRLSQSALETLAIIAYKQPITKLEVEQIRGVNCDYSIQKLLEKELITISGKAETIGKPLLYSTSTLFMDYFGISSKSQLPQLKDIAAEQNEIGEKPE
ncbi:SMC-Scp complex subunit ScpB [Desertivirga brevis]|uniref:SMC-Scp complex subunit ScpB n=1 Tax=Desertivirga brevis TaxID=2810310 RepID=UPI002103CE6A|nr:SMC-Scp complex subunit ScpB [Pedobacter sp. SYSU D00873]